MPDEKAQSGAFLPPSPMHFCSGKPMHLYSGVDTRGVRCRKAGIPRQKPDSWRLIHAKNRVFEKCGDSPARDRRGWLGRQDSDLQMAKWEILCGEGR
jgi:hypothetical protein